MNILVVDDSKDTQEVLERHLTGAGHKVRRASSVEEAVGILEFHTVDLIISDIRMPKYDGFDLLRYVRENIPDTEIMMITGFPCIDSAVRSIRSGAEEYLVKPFTEEELLAAVGRMADKIAQRRAVGTDIAPIKSHGIIGDAPGIRTVLSLIQKAASTKANVLISGESGTGKELVARAIHYSGDRASAPFVSVNCTAIPDTLLESELFGHVRGAFTGARETRAGYFQIADGGTVFLDEIGDASLNMQGKLLRVLQSREIHVVGSGKAQKVDTRIIAATHKDLAAMVKNGGFREDLFYRLNVVNISVPSLRERGEDIFALLSFFTRKFSEETGRPAPTYADDALKAIRNHHWPGNIRELENLVERLMVVIDGDTVNVTDLPEFMRFSMAPGQGELMPLAEVEARHIRNVLTAVEGNKTRAAEILGIDRKTLRVKLKKVEAGEI